MRNTASVGDACGSHRGVASQTLTHPSPAPWRTLLFLIAIMIMASPVHASGQDKTLTLAALAAADYIQSCSVFFDGDNKHREMNPILGDYPSRRRMAAFGLAGILLSRVLADRFGPWVMDSIIETELLNVRENQRVTDGFRRETVAIVCRWNW